MNQWGIISLLLKLIKLLNKIKIRIRGKVNYYIRNIFLYRVKKSYKNENHFFYIVKKGPL